MENILKNLLLCKLGVLCLTLFFLPVEPCHALDVTLEWNASTEPAFDHYEVFARKQGEDYDYATSDWGGTTTQHTFPNLDNNTTYCFVVRTVCDYSGEKVSSYDSREVCALAPNSLPAPYNRGWEIIEGDVKGFKIFYGSNDPAPTPTLGPSSGIPALNLSGVTAVGVRLNLLPSATVPDFNPPVKIFIPCPGYSNMSGLDIYHYNGSDWALADDTWMVAGSRENYNNGNPSTIAIEVYRFSGVQAGAPAKASGSGGGGGGCFVDTASSQ